MAKGGVRSIKSLTGLNRKIKSLHRELAPIAAQRIAESWTGRVRKVYDQGLTVYGTPRPLSPAGNKVTLVKTGETRRGIGFFAGGRRVVFRAAGAAQWLTRYEIVPRAGELPRSWVADVERIMGEVLRGLVTK